MQSYISTTIKTEVLPPPLEKRRGIRHWRAAEISSRIWFLVEACVDQCAEIEIRQFVTTSASEAFHLEQSQRECRWSRVRIFMRFQEVSRQPLMYEELAMAYRSRSTGAQRFHLQSGHVITEFGVSAINAELVEDFELMYRCRGAETELHSYP